MVTDRRRPHRRTRRKVDAMFLKKIAEEHLAIRTGLARVLEGSLCVNNHQAGTPENSGCETSMMAMLNPKTNLQWINRDRAVQLALHSRRFIWMDRVKGYFRFQQLVVPAKVVCRIE